MCILLAVADAGIGTSQADGKTNNESVISIWAIAALSSGKGKFLSTANTIPYKRKKKILSFIPVFFLI